MRVHAVKSVVGTQAVQATRRFSSTYKMNIPYIASNYIKNRCFPQIGQNRAYGLTPKASPSSNEEDSMSSLSETAALDELIDSLLSAKDTHELSTRVAENALSFDQKFWLRLAARADTTEDEEVKDQLKSLATIVMQVVDAMVQKTDEQLSGSSEVLEQILIAAADEDTGEWQVPLPAEKVSAMRDVMKAQADQIDEAVLSSCFAWIKKASDDKLDGMVYILQTVLQIYASLALAGDASQDDSSELVKVLQAQESDWEKLIIDMSNEGKISEESFMEELQRKMETVVLSLSSGSYAQRIQAEYLQELQSRAKNVFDKL